MKELTKAEEEIMQIIWQIAPCFIRDVLNSAGEPKPAYTTIATVMKTLEKKGFLETTPFGNAFQFGAKISKEDYAKAKMNSFVENYFENSFSKLVSFFSKEKKINLNELEQILNEIKKAKEE